jgi:hypothetical protein
VFLEEIGVNGYLIVSFFLLTHTIVQPFFSSDETPPITAPSSFANCSNVDWSCRRVDEAQWTARWQIRRCGRWSGGGWPNLCSQICYYAFDCRLQSTFEQLANDDGAVIGHRSTSRSDGSAISQSIELHQPSDKEVVNMAQTQRSRYLKTGAIIAFILMVLVWLSPSQPSASKITDG